MAKLSITLSLVVMLVMAVSVAEGAITCGTVVKSLGSCKRYLKQGGSVESSCCNGVRSLNSAARTTGDRQKACNCLKALAKAYRANPKYAAALPQQCRVNIGYPISYNTNCNIVR